jgi:hypothetical protein
VFYDLDGTLIKTKNGGSGFPTNRADWMWWDSCVPGRLKREWEEGKHLVVLSNQGDGRPKVRAEWKEKLPLIAAKVSDFPCVSSSLSCVFDTEDITTGNDMTWKPMADGRCHPIPRFVSWRHTLKRITIENQVLACLISFVIYTHPRATR